VTGDTLIGAGFSLLDNNLCDTSCVFSVLGEPDNIVLAIGVLD
jgi:hypothetical protein